ncbi:hypothetical protein Q1695_005125 [Nippostrongylus brasiliensis]|nr:hypothetical protein Q1695_005125 [Nippostrongylus brasiliensis]
MFKFAVFLALAFALLGQTLAGDPCRECTIPPGRMCCTGRSGVCCRAMDAPALIPGKDGEKLESYPFNGRPLH